MSEYTVNPQTSQDSIEAFLTAQYPGTPIIPDGMPDMDDDDRILKFQDGRIKPFIILWFSTTRRSTKGRSFGGYKLDSHYASVDIVVVSSNPTVGRTLINDVSDRLTGFRAQDGGALYKSRSLWGQNRSVEMNSKPARWAMTDRFDFGVSSRKVTP